MDDESAFDIGPWLKTDLISGFSDLLDDKISPAELQSSAATFDSADLGMDETAALCAELSSDQVGFCYGCNERHRGLHRPPGPR